MRRACFLKYVLRHDGWVGCPPPPSVVAASEAHGPAGSAAEDAWFASLPATLAAGGTDGTAAAAGAAPAQRDEEQEALMAQLERLTLSPAEQAADGGGAGGVGAEVDSRVHIEGGEMPRWD